MIFGEGIVLRLLDKGRMVFNLSNVGMMSDVYAAFKQLIDLPHGILLATGPTGSGKTTTLYSGLNEIKDESTKIITVEDPVEYQQVGISQIQVHSKIGLTFAAALRSILRHDPDVILIGEMRDLETATSAIQASLTGHLVFSTLHTNDAPSAFTRLIDMGIEPFLVASSVNLVLAQRLVRKVCVHCKRPATLTDEILSELQLERAQLGEATILEGAGCLECNNTGHRGRAGVYEVMAITPVLRDLILQRASAIEIKRAAVQGGMLTLRRDALMKLMRGVTSVEEVLKETAADKL
jgi:general secretion pathway protein E/type IV pilus assembly protein PilB